MNTEPAGSGEILLYNNGGAKELVSVVFVDENFWLSQSGMAELFDCTPENIIQHLKNIYSEEELTLEATAKKFLVVRQEGARSVRRKIDHYNLDAIIAVGYRLVTMFIDYAELMAEDEQPMSMRDWLAETDRFLTNNRRNVLPGKGSISRDDAVKKASDVYAAFRKKQDADYISEFDRETAKYLKGGEPK